MDDNNNKEYDKALKAFNRSFNLFLILLAILAIAIGVAVCKEVF